MNSDSRMCRPGTLVRTDLELFTLWQALIGEPSFARRALWLIFFDQQARVSPLVLPIEDVPDEPDLHQLSNVTSGVRSIITSEHDLASVAALLCRPGPAAMQPSDRRWAAAIRAAMGELSPWPVHLATRRGIVPFAVDDLIAS